MIPLAAIAFARRWWPALAIVALLLAAWGWGRVQYRAGERACEAAHAAAAMKQQARDQARVDQADAASAQAQAGIDRVERHYVERVREIYRDRPARPCLDAAGVGLVREADAAPAGQPASILPDAVRRADAPGHDG